MITSPSPYADALRLSYICHPYASDPIGNRERVTGICRLLEALDPQRVPIAPHLALSYLTEGVHCTRARGMALCLRLLASCDELLICADARTAGMTEEIAWAEAHHIAVHTWADIFGGT